jgi:hypothetical protein
VGLGVRADGFWIFIIYVYNGVIIEGVGMGIDGGYEGI